MDLLDLTGKVVIVTGASSGIGAATARLLHEASALPVLAARREDRIEALGTELGGALAVPVDVTDPAAISRLVDATLARHGRIDGLVNNAGVSLHRPLEQLDLSEFARVLDLNVISVVAMIQAVLPAMRAQGEGRIVNVSSGTTRTAMPGVGAYAATKSALNMLSTVGGQEGTGGRRDRGVARAALHHRYRVRWRPVQARRRGLPRRDPAQRRVRRPGHPAGAAHGRGAYRYPAGP
jgi:NADP-dependent 3-hydroxy acid dehydrogenase YdfG